VPPSISALPEPAGRTTGQGSSRYQPTRLRYLADTNFRQKDLVRQQPPTRRRVADKISIQNKKLRAATPGHTLHRLTMFTAGADSWLAIHWLNVEAVRADSITRH